MKRHLFAAALLMAGCSVSPLTGNPIGAPLTNRGVTLQNGCLADAAECCTELKDSGAEAAILLVEYVGPDGKQYGHALTRYFWPPRHGADGKGPLNTGSVAYVYDRLNASTPLPARVNANDCGDVAAYMLPSEIWSQWADPHNP